jgi:hypothetical protein
MNSLKSTSFQLRRGKNKRTLVNIQRILELNLIWVLPMNKQITGSTRNAMSIFRELMNISNIGMKLLRSWVKAALVLFLNVMTIKLENIWL